jgi:hypothetical protein
VGVAVLAVVGVRCLLSKRDEAETAMLESLHEDPIH